MWENVMPNVPNVATLPSLRILHPAAERKDYLFMVEGLISSAMIPE